MYLTQFFNNNMRPMKAIWRRQYLAKLLGGRGKRKSSTREHELPWSPIHFRFERYLYTKFCNQDQLTKFDVTDHL